METEFITPMSAWGNIGNIGNAGDVAGSQRTGGQSNGQLSLFTDVFKNAVDQVRETQEDVELKQYLLATGQIDDVHTLPIAEAKAGLTLDVLITLRNKTLEAYNELIKINV
ncbi:MAG: flagellar hook-basal body complex protein FliE [Lachnospiraceae bacterium]|nr:flagellar hook-basal body complex protein FliE [Lachnospiraceae bacterium]